MENIFFMHDISYILFYLFLRSIEYINSTCNFHCTRLSQINTNRELYSKTVYRSQHCYPRESIETLGDNFNAVNAWNYAVSFVTWQRAIVHSSLSTVFFYFIKCFSGLKCYYTLQSFETDIYNIVHIHVAIENRHVLIPVLALHSWKELIYLIWKLRVTKGVSLNYVIVRFTIVKCHSKYVIGIIKICILGSLCN